MDNDSWERLGIHMDNRSVVMNKHTNLLELEEHIYHLEDVEEPNTFRNLFPYDEVPKIAFNNRIVPHNMPEHISYDKIVAVSSVDSFITCPIDLPWASIALKIEDNSMAPRLEKGIYAFIEFNTPLENKDIGLIEFNGKIMIRRYVIRKDDLVFRADNKEFPDIIISDTDTYNIIGKVIGTNTGLIF